MPADRFSAIVCIAVACLAVIMTAKQSVQWTLQISTSHITCNLTTHLQGVHIGPQVMNKVVISEFNFNQKGSNTNNPSQFPNYHPGQIQCTCKAMRNKYHIQLFYKLQSCLSFTNICVCPSMVMPLQVTIKLVT